MPVIRTETFVHTSPERCFNLARDVGLHTRSAARTGERAVAGVTSGTLGPGDTVTWEAVHFGLRQRLTVRITRFEPPRLFVDEQVRGPFRSLRHVHEFEPRNGGTLVRDTFTYTSPLGPVGALADRLFLERYLRRFLVERNQFLKRVAESG